MMNNNNKSKSKFKKFSLYHLQIILITWKCPCIMDRFRKNLIILFLLQYTNNIIYIIYIIIYFILYLMFYA